MSATLDLCQLSSVKAMIGIEPEVDTMDAVLEQIITQVSCRIRNYLGREILLTSHTDYFTVEDGATLFAVKGYPITALTSVKNSLTWDWSGTTSISTSYVNVDCPEGIVCVFGEQLIPGYRALQIVYTGGMATNTESLLAGQYADIGLACTKEVINVWRNRASFGVTNAGAGPASVSYDGGGMLDDVKKILEPYRRPRFV